MREGRLEVAARLIARAVAMFQEIGLSLESWMTREVDEATAAVRAQLDDAAFAEASERGEKLTLDEAVARALSEADEDSAPTPG